MIVFLDANALIYQIEGHPAFSNLVRAQIIALAEQHSDLRVALSRLSWLECRVGPMKSNDAELLATYDQFFAQPDLVWVELSQSVVKLAAAIRARHGLRTPDALQAASCLQLGPNHCLLSGDAAFQRVHGLQVFILT